MDIGTCCSIEIGLLCSKEYKIQGNSETMTKQHDLRMRRGLVFGLDYRYCFIVLLQVLWRCWRPCRQFCSPKARAGASGPFRPSQTLWLEENIVTSLFPALLSSLSSHANDTQTNNIFQKLQKSSLYLSTFFREYVWHHCFKDFNLQWVHYLPLETVPHA